MMVAEHSRPVRVLVVDDSPDIVENTALLLKLDGHDVATATSGPDALILVKVFRPELALLDIVMPGLNGYAVAQRIQDLSLPRKPYLVAVTGHAEQHSKQRSAEAGFDLHLKKPVYPETYTALAGLVRGSKSTTERARSLNGHSKVIATDLVLQQLAMANTYLDIAATSPSGDSSRMRLIAHASRAHDRVSAWLFSGACADDRAGDMFRELRMLRDRIRK
jgi:two-component system, OmpR family, response regulator